MKHRAVSLSQLSFLSVQAANTSNQNDLSQNISPMFYGIRIPYESKSESEIKTKFPVFA